MTEIRAGMSDRGERIEGIAASRSPRSVSPAGPVSPAGLLLPWSFSLWLSGNSLSLLGDVVLYFALGWAASAHGGRWAGAVLSAIVVPRIAFILFGGALGDRFGARAVMLVSNGVMIAVASGFAICTARFGTPIWLLLAVAALIGTVDAFYLPSSGSMPARLLAPAQIPRAMALQQIIRQGIAVVGAPLGGLVVAGAGVSAAAGLDAGSFVVMLVLICLIRSRRQPVTPYGRRSAYREAVDGLRFVGRDSVLRTLLLLTASVAGFLIPVTSLLIPLMARENHWGSAQVGMITGAQAAGIIILAGYALGAGALARPGIAMASGLLIAGLALGGLAIASTLQVAVGWEFVVGLGTGLFVTQLAPLILVGTAQSHLSRVQAVLLLAQSVPLLLTTNLLGWVAGSSAVTAVGLCAAVTVLSAVGALCVPALRAVASPLQ